MSTELYLWGALGWILLAIAIFLHGRLAREVDRLTRYQNAAKGRGYYTEAEVDAAWERLKHVNFKPSDAELAASVDTHAKCEDSTQIEAPSPMGSAVGEAETPAKSQSAIR